MLLSSTLSLGCCPVSVSSGGGLHDCVQSSSRAEQVHQSRSLMTTDTSEHLLWPFFLSLQSWCHGLFLWLHLGHHHPRVPHSYPFIIDLWGYVDVQLSCKCLIYLHVFLGSCFNLKWSSVFFFWCPSLTLVRYSPQTWRDWEETNSCKQCFPIKRTFSFTKKQFLISIYFVKRTLSITVTVLILEMTYIQQSLHALSTDWPLVSFADESDWTNRAEHQ